MDSKPPQKTSLTGLSTKKRELISLKFAILPLAITASMILFFEFLDPEALDAASLLKGHFAEPDAIWSLKEQRIRLLWGGSVVIWCATGIAAIVFGFMVARALLSRPGFHLYLLFGLGFTALLALNLLVVSWLRSPLSALYFYPYDTLSASGFYGADRIGFIGGVVTLLNCVLCVAPISALLGGCSALVDPEAQGEDLRVRMEQQMRHLRGFLHIGSLLLVASILNLSLWLHWPSTLIADPILAHAAGEFASSVSLFWGAAASLLIASFYLPAYIRLNGLAYQRAQADPVLAKLDYDEWMKKNRMAQSPVQRLPQFAALIAPLLAAPLTDAITGISFV